MGYRLSPRATKALAASWYCCYYAGLAAIVPFLNVFLSSKGLTDGMIGSLSSARMGVGLASVFVWTAAADRWRAHRALLLVTLVMSTAARVGLNWGNSFAVIMVISLIESFFSSPVAPLSDAIIVSSAVKDGDYGKIRAFGALGWGAFSTPGGAIIQAWGYLAGFITSAALTLPCIPATASFRIQEEGKETTEALDSGVEGADTVDASDRRSVDLVGSATSTLPLLSNSCSGDGQKTEQEDCLATKAPAALAEPAAPTRSSSSSSSSSKGSCGGQDATDCSAVEAEVCILELTEASVKPGLETIGISKAATAAAAAEAEELRRIAALPFSTRLKMLLSRLDAWLFLWGALLQGYGLGLYQAYLFLTLQRMGAGTTLMGLCITVDCIAEVPAFWFKEQVLRYLSVDALLHISVLGYVLRLTLYALLPFWKSPWLVLPIQLLHGLTYAWGWGAGTLKGKKLAPPGLSATMQGLFQGAYVNLGTALAGVVGGFLMQAYGDQVMWGATAASILVGWALQFVVQGVAAMTRLQQRRRCTA